jgi:hypothetical protein
MTPANLTKLACNPSLHFAPINLGRLRFIFGRHVPQTDHLKNFLPANHIFPLGNQPINIMDFKIRLLLPLAVTAITMFREERFNL